MKPKQNVPISEANQNFSKVARMVEKVGEVYILKITNQNINLLT